LIGAIVLVEPLIRSYDRPTVTIHGNVARATHGETRREVLGSGDAASGFQRFTLKQRPLTYVSSPTASGAETTLQVRVNDVLWREQPALHNLPARERAYITRLDDDGNATLTFGDGVNGSRLPTGDENIVAIYRNGIGAAGMLKAGQLSLLLTRPLGLQKVTNPLAPTGAADPESRDQARVNAPFTVLTLDRIVSLRDFEDFARAFAGIGKAQATWLWDGEQRMVHLTIATAASNGADYTVDPQSALFANLRLAMDAARDTVQRLVISSYEPIFFRLQARVVIDPSYIADMVLVTVAASLRQAYAFEQRDFGQPVHKNEVLAVIQAVAGVTAVFLDQLYLRGMAADLPMALLPASRARREGAAADQQGEIRPAQLLLLDPKGIDVTKAKI
jgi:predicted phage baseplate assembly protein